MHRVCSYLCALATVLRSVRRNGLLVFVPKYGLRGPLFMADTHGVPLLPPAAFQYGVTPDTRSVSARARSRAIELARQGRDAVVAALEAEGAVKEAVPGARVLCDRAGVVTVTPAPTLTNATAFRVSVLDCIMVQVSCDFTDAHVRRPPLRYRLVAATPLAQALSSVGHTHAGGPAAQHSGHGSDHGGDSDAGSGGGVDETKADAASGGAVGQSPVGGGEGGGVTGGQGAPGSSDAAPGSSSLYTALETVREATVGTHTRVVPYADFAVPAAPSEGSRGGPQRKPRKPKGKKAKAKVVRVTASR